MLRTDTQGESQSVQPFDLPSFIQLADTYGIPPHMYTTSTIWFLAIQEAINVRSTQIMLLLVYIDIPPLIAYLPAELDSLETAAQIVLGLPIAEVVSWHGNRLLTLQAANDIIKERLDNTSPDIAAMAFVSQ